MIGLTSPLISSETCGAGTVQALDQSLHSGPSPLERRLQLIQLIACHLLIVLFSHKSLVKTNRPLTIMPTRLGNLIMYR